MDLLYAQTVYHNLNDHGNGHMDLVNAKCNHRLQHVINMSLNKTRVTSGCNKRARLFRARAAATSQPGSFEPGRLQQASPALSSQGGYIASQPDSFETGQI